MLYKYITEKYINQLNIIFVPIDKTKIIDNLNIKIVIIPMVVTSSILFYHNRLNYVIQIRSLSN